MILFWILWFVVGAAIAFGSLVYAHKHGYIDEADQLGAFIILIIPPVGAACLVLRAGVWVMDKVTKFIERRF